MRSSLKLSWQGNLSRRLRHRRLRLDDVHRILWNTACDEWRHNDTICQLIIFQGWRGGGISLVAAKDTAASVAAQGNPACSMTSGIVSRR